MKIMKVALPQIQCQLHVHAKSNMTKVIVPYERNGGELHGNPYSLTLISIDGHLHSPLICLVDVRLSSPFLSNPQPPFYTTIVLYPWPTLIYCVKIEKV